MFFGFPFFLYEIENNYEADISQHLRITTAALDFYEELRDSYSWWNSTKGAEQSQVDLCAYLAEHDLGTPKWPSQLYWNDIEERYHDQTGTYSYSDARAKLSYVLNASNIQYGDTPEVKMRKILEFVNSRIVHNEDLGRMTKSPWETLAFGMGDCDDTSTLVAALFESVGIDSAIAFYHYNETVSHAMVLVHQLDLNSPISRSYENLTGFGLSDGRWLEIESQFTLEHQSDKDWFSKFDIWVAAEVDISSNE